MSCCGLGKRVYDCLGLNHEDANNFAEAEEILADLGEKTNTDPYKYQANGQSCSQFPLITDDFIQDEIDKLKPNKVAKALDLGSGNCMYTITLLSKKKYSVTAIDTSKKALEELEFSYLFSSININAILVMLKKKLGVKVIYYHGNPIISAIISYFKQLYLDLQKADFLLDPLVEKKKFLTTLSPAFTFYDTSLTTSFNNFFSQHFNDMLSFFNNAFNERFDKQKLTTHCLSIADSTSNLSESYDIIVLRDSLPYCDPNTVGTILSNCFNALNYKGKILGNFFTYPTESSTNISLLDGALNIYNAYTTQQEGSWTTTAKTIKIFIKSLIQTEHDLEFFESDGKVGFKITKL